MRTLREGHAQDVVLGGAHDGQLLGDLLALAHAPDAHGAVVRHRHEVVEGGHAVAARVAPGAHRGAGPGDLLVLGHLAVHAEFRGGTRRSTTS